MSDYYKEKLSAERLRRCYEIAPPRIQQYFRAEIDYICSGTDSNDTIVELGCGFGRVLPPLCEKAARVVGIDNSVASIREAGKLRDEYDNLDLVCCHALHLPFADASFDRVFCVQNGISAFHVDPPALFREALRVTKPGGKALFSSYSVKVWLARLEWFRAQAAEGLLGEIDEERTGNGQIVCKDGFSATTITPDQFRSWATQIGLDPATDFNLIEIDESSLFLETKVPE